MNELSKIYISDRPHQTPLKIMEYEHSIKNNIIFNNSRDHIWSGVLEIHHVIKCKWVHISQHMYWPLFSGLCLDRVKKNSNQTRVRCLCCEVVGAKQNHILNDRYKILISQMAIICFAFTYISVPLS